MTPKYKTKEYKTWLRIKNRCLNPKDNSYKHYGGRGITVCQRWRDSFDSFLADVGLKPSAEYSIGRIDNDKGYEPGNVRVMLHWIVSDKMYPIHGY